MDMFDHDYEGDEVFRPALHFETLSDGETQCVQVYLQVFEARDRHKGTFRSLPQENWHLLVRVSNNQLTMFPVFANPYAQRYMASQVSPLKSLIYQSGTNWDLPNNIEDTQALINYELNECFYADLEKGLGLHKNLSAVPSELGRVKGINSLVISESLPEHDSVLRAGDSIFISPWYLKQMLKASSKIYRKYTLEIRLERSRMVHNMVLPKLDAAAYPIKLRRPRPGEVSEFLKDVNQSSISNVDRQAAVSLVQSQLPSIVRDNPKKVLELQFEVERVTLNLMIEKFKDLLDGNTTEPTWQKFFEDYVFILSILFTRKAILMHSRPQTRSAALSGKGAQFGDFLFGEGVGGLALIEIKTPKAKLIGKMYRTGSTVYSLHEELTGPITQVLHQRLNLIQKKLIENNYDQELMRRNAASIRCVVIAGLTPVDRDQLISLDLYRNSAKDVEIITFDELYGKLVSIRELLSGGNYTIENLPPIADEKPEMSDIS